MSQNHTPENEENLSGKDSLEPDAQAESSDAAQSDVFLAEDDLLFADEIAPDSPAEFIHVEPQGRKWKVLIADDDPEVHSLTRMVLRGFSFENRGLEFISAYSGDGTVKALEEHPDIAVVLLDVVMETNHAGLEACRFIREELGNSLVRIILRTGQAGQAPERHVITSYDINDYKQKTELTAQRLFVSLMSAIRSYRDLRTIEDNRKVLNKLALSVSHQIRNRLMPIGGFINLLLRKQSLSPSAQEQAKVVLEESVRLEQVVKAVSSFASLPQAVRSEQNLEEIINGAITLLQRKADEHQRKLELNLQIVPLTILADAPLMGRALYCLLENALDFTPVDPDNPQAPVKIALFTTICAHTDERCCTIRILDNGAGLLENELEEIFEPLITTKADGVGMGLCVAQRIIAEHKGHLGLENSLDSNYAGAMAVVTLPVPVESQEE